MTSISYLFKRKDYTRNLSNFDHFWYQSELKNPASLAIVVAMKLKNEVDLDALKEAAEERLLIHRRFKSYPEGMFWVLDQGFDLDNHIKFKSAKGRSLEEIVNDVTRTPLPSYRPLWDMHVITDLAEGNYLILRFHHCIADGIALVELLMSFTDMGEPKENGNHAKNSNGSKSKFSLMNLVRSFFLLLAAIWQLIRIVFHIDAKTVLKTPPAGKKVAATCQNIPLEDVKLLSRKMGGTVNDVLLGALAGALRKYLDEQGSLVDKPITATIPFNLRGIQCLDSSAIQLVNDFSLLYVDIPTHLETPESRVNFIHDKMETLKQGFEPLFNFWVMRIVGLAPSWFTKVFADFFSSKASLLVTNVPGPKEQRTLAGNPIENITFWAPTLGAVAVGVSIFSYNNSICVGVSADLKVVAEPKKIAYHFEEELKSMMKTCVEQVQGSSC